jgi:hypothetical protein
LNEGRRSRIIDDMIDSISKLKHDRFILLAVIVACVIYPGFVFLFVFERDLFVGLDFLKIMMLALAPTALLFLVNLLPSYLYFHRPVAPHRPRWRQCCRARSTCPRTFISSRRYRSPAPGRFDRL